MGKVNKDSLGFLGHDYQLKLMNQLLTDKKFGESILDILDPNVFDDPAHRMMCNVMVESYKKEVVIDIEGLKMRLASVTNSDSQQQKHLAYIKQIQESTCNDCDFVQETAMRFFKQQNLKKAISDIQKIIEKGGMDEYHHCEAIIKKALEAGDNKDDSVDVTSNIEDVLREDYRDPIPTGITGLDEVMNGGLAKGELAIILAATGIGKTTMMTKIANGAKDMGKKVLQIFFEDSIQQVQRKHLACWTGIEMNQLSAPENRDMVLAVNEEKRTEVGQVRLKRFPSDGTTIPMIKKYIKKISSSGYRPDVVLLDYIDVVSPSETHKDQNVAEGKIMRQFESMLSELDIAGWTAIQGNRSAINTEFVDTDQMGGSIKRAQIGHFILSIARSMEQKEAGLANMAILKSRLGRDGITFEDIIFDNGTVNIEVTDNGGKTFLQSKSDKTDRMQENLKDMLKDLDKKKGRVKEPEAIPPIPGVDPT
jgi:replicative DNA helicase